MSLSAAQKAYIQHIIVKEWDVPAARAAMKNGDLMSDAQFAEFLGLHTSALAYWKKHPEFLKALEKARLRMENSNDYFLECMRYRADEELWKNYLTAKGAEKRKYLGMVFDRTKDVGVSKDTIDLSEMTDEELLDLMLEHEISTVGISPEELRLLESRRQKLMEPDGSDMEVPQHVRPRSPKGTVKGAV